MPATPFGVTEQFIAIAPEAVYGTAPVAFKRREIGMAIEEFEEGVGKP